MDIPATVNMVSCCNHSPPECIVAQSASDYMHNNVMMTVLFIWKTKWGGTQDRNEPSQKVKSQGTLPVKDQGRGQGGGWRGILL